MSNRHQTAEHFVTVDGKCSCCGGEDPNVRRFEQGLAQIGRNVRMKWCLYQSDGNDLVATTCSYTCWPGGLAYESENLSKIFKGK